MKQYYSIIINKPDDSFIKEWQTLWERAENANIFNSYEWFLLYTEAYEIKNYEILACFKSRKLVAVLPLYKKKRFGLLVSASIGDTVEPTFLIEKYDKKLFKHFFTNIIKKRSLYLIKVDEKAVAILRSLFPRMFFPLVSANPYISLGDDPFRFMSKSNLKNLKKMLRRNAEDIRFELYDDTNDLEKYLQMMFSLEEKSAKKLRSMDIFSKEENREFFRNMVKYCHKFVKIGILYYQDIPVAYQFGLQYRNIFLAEQTAYLFEYRKLDPGKTMLARLLNELVGTSVTKFDFGGGMSMYKREFTPEYHCFYDLYISKNVVFMLWWKSINNIRRIKQVLFPLKNTRDHEFLFSQFKPQTGK